MIKIGRRSCGGLAVYLHMQNRPLGKLPVIRQHLVEFSHDIDACISLQDLGGGCVISWK